VGPFTALVILAEIGDVSPFGSARKLASWAGLTPTVRGSDRVAHHGHISKVAHHGHISKVAHHGHISKQGSAWLRWVLCEAAPTKQFPPAHP
jgi:transposase